MNSIISVNGLTRRYGQKIALDGVSFSIEPGTVFGFLGPNGAGKTTAIKLLLGLLQPTRGSIQVLGKSIPDQVAEIRPKVGVLLENNGVYDRLTVGQNFNFFGEAYGMPKADIKERAGELSEWLGISDLMPHRVSLLSTGERRKLGIARAFMHRPELIFLDEPTLGLDVETALSLRETILRLVEVQHVTVFLTTHHLQEVERLCDRVVVLREGRVVADTTPRELANRSRKPIVTVQARELTQGAIDAVRALPGVASVVNGAGELQVTYLGEPDSAALVKALVVAGASVQEVRADHGEFERTFIDLMREGSPS